MNTLQFARADDKTGTSDLSRRRNGLVAFLSVPLLLAACSHSSVRTQTGTPDATADTPSPSVTVNSEGAPAVAAYLSFNDAIKAAERHPFGVSEKPPPAADFSKVSFDPLLAEYQAQIANLKLQGIAYHGDAPKPHVEVKRVNLKASPWPTVTLTDCQTDNDHWRVYVVTTGAELPRTTPSVLPPYEATATVILYHGHWGVQKIKVDTSRTCTG